MRSGYAGKIQTGVIVSIVKDSVDHLQTVSTYVGQLIKDKAVILT